MIIEFFIDVSMFFLKGLLVSVAFANLPLDLIDTVATATSYGNYIVGRDLMYIVMGNITTWISFKLAVGIVLFLWRLLPLT